MEELPRLLRFYIVKKLGGSLKNQDYVLSGFRLKIHYMIPIMADINTDVLILGGGVVDQLCIQRRVMKFYY